jgi:two-component system response regulator (stage 0 sporulation protein F)
MAADRNAPPQSGSRASSRVLVVDDEEVMRRLMARAIGGSGHLCVTAGSGGEAVELLRRGSFDLAVIDKNLPDLSGIEVARRTRDFFRRFAVIIVTGYPSDESRREAEALGAATYLVKPFDVETLRREVSQALDAFFRPSSEPTPFVTGAELPLHERPTRQPPRRSKRRSSEPAAFTRAVEAAETRAAELDLAVLILEPDERVRDALLAALGRSGCRVAAFGSPHQAEIHARHTGYDVLIAPPELIDLAAGWAGLVAGGAPLGTVAVVDGGSVDRRIAAIQAGARGVIDPPFAPGRVVSALAAAVAQMREDRARLTIPPAR